MFQKKKKKNPTILRLSSHLSLSPTFTVHGRRSNTPPQNNPMAMLRSMTPPPLSSSTATSSSSPLLSFFTTPFPRPSNNQYRHNILFRPLSSLRGQSKEHQTAVKKPSDVPQSFPFEKGTGKGVGGGGEGEEEGGVGDGDAENAATVKGVVLAGLLLVGVVGGFGSVGYIYRDQINVFLTQFSSFIEGYGPAGYALFVAVYAGLEILAIPAIPLTMSAGLLFGSITGTILVSISGTIAASTAFIIARYFARERILKLVEGNKKFLAIDKAIGENGFRVVTLLRLSPLLPFSLGNYLYGLTSVKFAPYAFGSWLGMLPGTWAYVSAGAFGRAIITEESGISLGGNGLITLGIGFLATALAATYVTRLAKDAMKDVE